jgi:aspartyl-tRNA(Asn)/glutamyl-tRNA(Gln) amidotransferase subunit B
MASGEEAELYVQQLRRLVRYLGVCDGNMEEGSLRADANISINTPGAGLGRKVEIKNQNSTRFIRLGLNYERERQAKRLDNAKIVTQETRLWNENRDQTEVMRTKENAHDYRYFPEPDLPVFIPDAAFLASVDASLVEPPLDKRRRFIADYALSDEQADLLCDERAVADYFEQATTNVVAGGMPKKDAAQKCANWILTDIKHLLANDKKDALAINATKLTAERLAALITLVAAGTLSAKNAKKMLPLLMANDKEPAALMAEKNWAQISDPTIIGAAFDAVSKREAAALAEAREAAATGNAKRLATLQAFFVGKVIAETHGRANPEVAGTLVKAALEKR